MSFRSLVERHQPGLKVLVKELNDNATHKLARICGFELLATRITLHRPLRVHDEQRYEDILTILDVLKPKRIAYHGHFKDSSPTLSAMLPRHLVSADMTL